MSSTCRPCAFTNGWDSSLWAASPPWCTHLTPTAASAARDRKRAALCLGDGRVHGAAPGLLGDVHGCVSRCGDRERIRVRLAGGDTDADTRDEAVGGRRQV